MAADPVVSSADAAIDAMIEAKSAAAAREKTVKTTTPDDGGKGSSSAPTKPGTDPTTVRPALASDRFEYLNRILLL